MITQEQLKETAERTEALHRYLDIDSKKIEVEEEELRTHVPDFWEHPKEAQAQMKKIKDLQAWIEGYAEVADAVEELTIAFEFVKEGEMDESELDALYASTIDKIERLELRNMLRREEDKLGVVLKINSGAGGTESQDWAQMLMRMYLRWCEAHGYKTSMANLLEGDEAGIKSCTINVEGDFAYGYLKSENGVHRLVRVSPYNAQGKRMTSFASVFVTPLVDDTIEVRVDPALLSWDTFRSGALADRTSTRWNRACVCATSSPTPTPARKRRYSSRTPKPATSPRTRRTPCVSCAPYSTTRNCSTVCRSRPRSRPAR